MLLQNPNDLLFRIQALLHRQLPHSIYERTPNSNGRYFRGQVNWEPWMAKYQACPANHNALPHTMKGM
jgi:hypothetical protein